jgi:hypothetical protein
VNTISQQSAIQTNQGTSSGQFIELKEGEVHAARVKTRISDNEAILQIKGQDVQVKFEGKVPSQDRIMVQVEGRTGETPLVKAIPNAHANSVNPELTKNMDQKITHILTRLGYTSPTPELKNAVQMILDRNIPITKELVRDINSFMNRTEGTLTQKLEALQMFANKGVEITLGKLEATLTALHGKGISSLLSKSEMSSRNSSTTRSHIADQEKNQQTNQRINQTIIQMKQNANNPNSLRENTLQVRSLIEQATVSSSIKAEANQLLSMISELSARQPASVEEESSIRSTIDKLEQLVQAQVRAQLQLGQSADTGAQTYEKDNLDQTSVQLSSKDVMITEITKRLAVATDQFKELKREITRNLDNLVRMIQQAPSQAIHHSKPLLESTIDILDKAILKSEITSLTDMKTEKHLMQASSELAKARALLEKGNPSEAMRVLAEVKDQLQKLNWQPSDVKIRHFLTKESLFIDDVPKTHRIANVMEHTARMGTTETPSARSTYEMIRMLGLNHDSEVAQTLSSQRDGQPSTQQEGNQKNLKSLLLQALKGEQELTTTQKGNLQQALQGLTGQQLLSKSDGPNQLQSMFFNLPFASGEEVKNLKVFINSKKGGEKVDWENCSLYFLIDTKKVGETGILINASNRNLSITIRNDHPELKEKLAPMVEACKENLKEIGYNISGVQFSKLSQQDTKDNNSKNTASSQTLHDTNSSKNPTMRPTSTKGFDFKI